MYKACRKFGELELCIRVVWCLAGNNVRSYSVLQTLQSYLIEYAVDTWTNYFVTIPTWEFRCCLKRNSLCPRHRNNLSLCTCSENNYVMWLNLSVQYLSVIWPTYISLVGFSGKEEFCQSCGEKFWHKGSFCQSHMLFRYSQWRGRNLYKEMSVWKMFQATAVFLSFFRYPCTSKVSF